MDNLSNQISIPLIDRISGALRCHAIGNALGGPHKLKGGVPYDKYNGVIQFPLRCRSQYRDFKDGVVGQVSDDTEMTIILLKSLFDGKWWNREIKIYIGLILVQ